MKSEVLRVESLGKTLVNEKALKSITFNIFANETLSVVGAHGASKTALINILGGTASADSGRIYIKEKPVVFKSPQDAKMSGIYTIYDKSHVLNNLTVAENIGLGKEKGFFLNKRAYTKETERYLREVCLESISPHTLASELSPTQKAFLEIAMAIATHPDLLVFDQSYLFNREQNIVLLHSTFKNLNRNNTAVLYFAHNIENALHIGDRIFVMRDGISAGSMDQNFCTTDIIASRVNPNAPASMPQKSSASEQTLLDIHALSGTILNEISFSVKKGEILGLFDFEGTLKTELLNILYGISLQKTGRLCLEGKEIKINTPSDASKIGFAYAPESAITNGIIADMSVKENITLSSLKHLSTFGWIRPTFEKIFSKSNVAMTSCEGTDINIPIDRCSDGLKQKFLITRCIACKPKLLLLDEPFKNMDTNSKEDIIKCINTLSKQGTATVIASTYLSDLQRICDRVVYMN